MTADTLRLALAGQLRTSWGLTPEEQRTRAEDPGFPAVLARLRIRLFGKAVR